MIRNPIVKLNCNSKMHGMSIFTKLMSTTQNAKVGQDCTREKKNIIFEDVGKSGVITLNRPEALNAFDWPMIQDLYSTLKKWEPKKKLVIIQGAGNNVFCAGGDVKTGIQDIIDAGNVTENYKHGTALAFKDMYCLDYLIGTYTKPYIAIMNGMTIGGGTALCVHGKYRIATDNTLYSVPENSIGLFPDAGNTHFLPRLKNRLGYFLGMTGYRLKGTDVLFAGIATHYIPSEKLRIVTEELLAENSNIDAVLKPYLPDKVKQEFSLEPYSELINRCFSEPNVEGVVKRLKEDGSGFAQKVLGLMSKQSPTSLKVTKKAFDEHSNLSLAECLKVEYRLLCRNLDKNSDFVEGVRALLIEKDLNPKWNPKTLEEVSDEYINKRFEPLPAEFELMFSKL